MLEAHGNDCSTQSELRRKEFLSQQLYLCWLSTWSVWRPALFCFSEALFNSPVRVRALAFCGIDA